MADDRTSGRPKLRHINTPLHLMVGLPSQIAYDSWQKILHTIPPRPLFNTPRGKGTGEMSPTDKERRDSIQFDARPRLDQHADPRRATHQDLPPPGLEVEPRRRLPRLHAVAPPRALHTRRHLLAARFSNVTTVHIDERLSVSIPAHLGRRRASGNSSVKLHYVNDKHGSASDQSDLDSLCISDSGLTALAEGFPKLEKLRLIFCSNVTSEGLSSLARKCTSLKSLDMQAFGCYVGDQGLAAVGQCCKQLEDLNLRFCEGLNDIGLVELALGVGNALKSLGVAACAKITDVSMEVTLSLDSEFIHNKGVLSVIKGCPHLKVLKLQCINLTDDVLKVVGTRWLSLELLALYSFQRFTDKGLCAIGNGCKNDKGLEEIATGCKELTHLEVNGCHNIGALGQESVGKSCQHLSELALLYCQRIGDAGLLQVGQGCKFLQALHLVDCSNIGNEAMCGIAIGCRNLKKLYIRRCYKNLVDIALTDVGLARPVKR
ncbi:F-box/LRR-repeat protein 4 [Glycine max]|nr:F-box/LRR-repeat protein 4 [Glycine max]